MVSELGSPLAGGEEVLLKEAVSRGGSPVADDLDSMGSVPVDDFVPHGGQRLPLPAGRTDGVNSGVGRKVLEIVCDQGFRPE